MLDKERLDVVQVKHRNDRIPFWAHVCLERGLVMAEKPLAMDLPTLEVLFQTAQDKGSPRSHAHDAGSSRAGCDPAGGACGSDRRPAHDFQPENLPVRAKQSPTFIATARRFPALPPGLAFTHLIGCTGSWAMSSSRCKDVRERRPAPTSRLRQPGGFCIEHAERRSGVGHARLSPPGIRPHSC